MQKGRFLIAFALYCRLDSYFRFPLGSKENLFDTPTLDMFNCWFTVSVFKRAKCTVGKTRKNNWDLHIIDNAIWLSRQMPLKISDPRTPSVVRIGSIGCEMTIRNQCNNFPLYSTVYSPIMVSIQRRRYQDTTK